MFEQDRQFMKSKFTGQRDTESDKSKGVPMPPFEDEYDELKLIGLPNPKTVKLKKTNIVAVFSERITRRKLGAGSISIDDLSFLLWAVAGMREIRRDRILRTVPSSGSRHPFETYFYADKVTGLKPGLYRYIATQNAVLPVSFDEELKEELNKDISNQWFHCAVAFFWVCNPYRAEWCYADQSHKAAIIDAGHIGQNGYLAAEALGIGCCTICDYIQDIDKHLGVDGENEFCVYVAVFGPYEN